MVTNELLRSLSIADRHNPLAREVAKSSTTNVVTSGSAVAQAQVWAGTPGNPEAEGEDLERKIAKRVRQREKKSLEQIKQVRLSKIKSTYSSYLRIAHGAYVQIPGDYYGSDEGVW